MWQKRFLSQEKILIDFLFFFSQRQIKLALFDSWLDKPNKQTDFKGPLLSLGEEIKTQNFNIYNINEVNIQTWNIFMTE